MSYDFAVVVDGQEIEPAFDDTHPQLHSDGMAGNVTLGGKIGYTRRGNYTSNVSPMWRMALSVVTGQLLGLDDLHGRSCKEVADVCQMAVAWMLNHRDELEPLNPPNGWGKYEGAVTYLWDIQRLCVQYPEGTLSLSY